MTNLKKILTRIAIICIILSALMGILGVFHVLKIEGVVLKILMTFLIFGITSLLSLNAVNLLSWGRRILPLISLSLLTISSLLALIFFWGSFNWGLFAEIMLVFIIFSVLFNIIVSYIIKLGFQQLVYQIVTYVLIGIFDLFITIQIFYTDFLDNEVISKILIIDIILSLVGMAILSIFTKRDMSDNYIRIKKSEYDALKARIAELEGAKKEDVKIEETLEDKE